MGCKTSRHVNIGNAPNALNNGGVDISVHNGIRRERRNKNGKKETVFYGFNIPIGDIEYDPTKDNIGSGSYGSVYKCRYEGRNFALKKINLPDKALDREDMLEDFTKEVRILSQISHPRIVNFYGAVNREPNYCLLFELCDGCVGTLLRMVRKKKFQVTWDICINIAKDCAEAVNYLHSLNPTIIHRDLKAENLLITSKFRCKLTDFGFAREFEDKGQMTVCGTPCWVAPEIFRHEAYTEKCDVYSFGIVLWELFTGRKPYTEIDYLQLPYRVGKMGLRPPLLKHVPDELNNLMKECWEENENKRPSFKKIQAVLADVERVVQDAGQIKAPAHRTKTVWQIESTALSGNSGSKSKSASTTVA